MQKKYQIVGASFILLLTACSSPTQSTNDAHSPQAIQSSTISSEVSADWTTENDEKFGLRFSYPSIWGQWSARKLQSQPNTYTLQEMTFSELERTIQYPKIGNADITVTLRRYDETNYRYEEVCDDERSVDLCDTMKQQDLLEEKNAFMAKATQKVGGEPAMIQDFYDVPSGYLARKVQLYTPTHRVHFSAIYDIGDFLITQGPNSESLYGTAKKILGPDLSDPIDRLSTMYPSELQGMTSFYQDVDRLLEGMKVIDTNSSA